MPYIVGVSPATARRAGRAAVCIGIDEETPWDGYRIWPQCER